MTAHLAVLLPRYMDAICRGEKTIESRFSRVRCAPFGRVHEGDTIWFKSGGGVRWARARVERCESYEALTARGVQQLIRSHRREIACDASYAQEKRHARYATLIWLDDVREETRGVEHPRLHGRGWLCLERVTRAKTAKAFFPRPAHA